MTKIGFGSRREEEAQAEYEDYIGKAVSISSHGDNYIGVLAEVNKDYLVLLPVVVPESLPTEPIKRRFRLETKTPARVNLPINSIFPVRREYLEEIVESTKSKS